MKKMKLGTSDLEVSNLVLGCMRMNELDSIEASKVIHQALDVGINFFDHADIYGGGRSEEIFAEAIGMKPSVRENVILQTKAGIRKGYYDFSKEHLLKSVDGSLKRLKTDYIDLFLLHRPDALVEPEEVAEAFQILKDSGKVRYFGVSNHTPYQIELLKKYVGEEIIVNQLQFGIMHTNMIDTGIQMNTKFENAVDRDGHVLDYCRLHNITVQAWSPFQYGFFEGVFIDNEKFPELNQTLKRIGEKYGLSKTALAIAWILRHPAKIQPIIGSMNPNRIKDISTASEVVITREEWYEIYRSAGNRLP
ncbi:aldo/keto reductase [Fervidibacillus halotolerans]|uniref:Aldo/keto reductase n=1 Tax=Fervidibacillus halotolerans TaxID=2980027 RepID=A0A9E8M0P8_9BACI|nr:aldo/keto reductase [Fervidibacillus halotolerans]WAA13343.1 aldo/keto reductase [Fervidibacillus halotolerans]